ncbi:MAG: AAA family ATPase, partial [Oligoflexales bacterium]|nr:AAA family ATPase [Oligoflexales bacterium]
MLDLLMKYHLEQVRNLPTNFTRYLYDRIDWNEISLGLIGARGVGKTTMLLQHWKNCYDDVERCLYISADNLHVVSQGLLAIAAEYFGSGGEALIIDEVHTYPDWTREIKNIIDSFKGRKILISGSSSAELTRAGADLSRRVAWFKLKGLSFREYLDVSGIYTHDPITFEELLRHHIRISSNIAREINILPYFKTYLKEGYYPFFIESRTTHLTKLLSVIDKVVAEDIPYAFNVNPSSIPVIKKLLSTIALSQPFVPNIEGLSRDLAISKEYVYLFLEYLEKTSLVMFLNSSGKRSTQNRKPKKILLENPNLNSALAHQESLNALSGTIRETFLASALSLDHRVALPVEGDFLIDDKVTFEVGGS